MKCAAGRDMMLAVMGTLLASERPQSDRVDTALSVEVSVVIPCLNEANSLAFCVDKPVNAFRASGLSGEVIVATPRRTARSKSRKNTVRG